MCWVGLYSLSSSVGWKAGDFTASEVSLAFPFRLGSASILRLRREFSCLNASISSALRFFRSTSSCCIFAWPSRMAAKSGVMLGGPEGPASAYLFAPALLRVETIFREKRVLKVFVSCPTVGANCSCREQIRSINTRWAPSVTLPCSPLSPQLASSRSIHVSLDPGGVTCRRVSEAQVKVL